MNINLPETAGIYAIQNIVNGNVYVGQSVNMYQRVRSNHLPELRNLMHFNPHLQSAFDKYGESAFKAYCLQECAESELDILEARWIGVLKPQYNIRDVYDPSKPRPRERKLKHFFKDDELLPRPLWHQRVYGTK